MDDDGDDDDDDDEEEEGGGGGRMMMMMMIDGGWYMMDDWWMIDGWLMDDWWMIDGWLMIEIMDDGWLMTDAWWWVKAIAKNIGKDFLPKSAGSNLWIHRIPLGTPTDQRYEDLQQRPHCLAPPFLGGAMLGHEKSENQLNQMNLTKPYKCAMNTHLFLAS